MIVHGNEIDEIVPIHRGVGSLKRLMST